MKTFDIYEDIMTRTNGDIYIGVVGPVRTGKSTFIKRLMEQLVVPSIKDENRRARIIDELPQSGSGKGIMTTEPKFVPDGGERVEFGEDLFANVRLIDSVGYIVADAEGYMDGEDDRLVSTPWSEEKMPFGKAGEYGTKKVICDHSTVGIVVTCDGSICGIPRASYVPSEERIIADMEKLSKPYVIILNSTSPNSDEAKALQQELCAKYNKKVILLDIASIDKDDINGIMESVLMEFPLRSVEIDLPSYMLGLDMDNYIISDIRDNILSSTSAMCKMCDAESVSSISSEYIDKVNVASIDFGIGEVCLDIKMHDNMFYKVLSDETGVDIVSDYDLFEYIKRLKVADDIYSKCGSGMEEANKLGYSVVMPTDADISISEPVLVKKDGKCHVKMTATAPSMHMMRVDMKADICPLMGTEEQCNETIEYIKAESAKGNIMDVTLFSKPIRKLVEDELESRANEVGADTRAKMVKAMTRIVNEGKGGVLLVLI